MLNSPDIRYVISERRQEILELLELQGRVSVSELAERLQVSDVTVRKDLQELEEQSLLKRIHGGAVPSHRSKYNLSLGDKLGKLSSAKLAIAYEALKFVHDGDTLILDAGSSVLALARLLPGRFRGLTVVTNSLPIISELSQTTDYDIISLGGMVRLHSLAMIGPLTVSGLRRLHADRVFLGATGATLERGLSTPNIIEAETKMAMVAAAGERIALVDHTKLGAASLAPFASWADIQHLVTDREPDAPLTRGLRDYAVSLSVAAES